jgi:hypothetical protein
LMMMEFRSDNTIDDSNYYEPADRWLLLESKGCRSASVKLHEPH